MRLATPALRVTKGGRTSSLSLESGTHVVGGGFGCDLVIVGTSPEPAFSLLLTKETGGISASISALREDIIVGDRLLKQNESIPLCAGQTIRFDGTECQVEGLRRPAGRRRHKMIAAGMLVVAALLLLGGFGNDETTINTAVSLKAATPTAIRPSSEAIAEELRQAIRLAQLPADMMVEPLATEIHVGENSSPLTFAGRAKLRDIIDALNRRSPVPIVDKSSVSSGLGGFVAAAGYEPFRFIVGVDGRRYHEGDAVASGWQIVKIAPGQLTVSRNGDIDTIYLDFPKGGMNPPARSVEPQGH
ncbi:SctD/MshK family protein [Sinorhizobium meliloti]|uniref:SctD/MshK family protein n=1 Tax=Rhizobium meliloti TaxID=382 RepID=UPI000FD82D7C|nr:hypothetical protein [Sinorhizobium meliloti]MDW9682806.1 hypothetical protein [Sinorhizobium meliloti]MDW9694002.1 hypothetical protein [Sinorhizobium meliloti]MDW9718898.1 hypothetical protein [Sinorhizobium meliloti]MDW9756094.1 hypothetical protein [Sinorhizobium meliloti]MDW9985643.1 hypothetical protein [Sinorhizobium meliloti]